MYNYLVKETVNISKVNRNIWTKVVLFIYLYIYLL